MLLKQLDNWVRRVVHASRAEAVERRSGRDRRQGPDRRKHCRSDANNSLEASDRRSNVDRREEPPQSQSIN